MILFCADYNLQWDLQEDIQKKIISFLPKLVERKISSINFQSF